MTDRRLSICLINPKLEPSYWGFDYALPLYPGDVRSTMINGALPTVAGLAGDHHVTILDENVAAIDFESLTRFDLVGVTGMTVQKARMVEILDRLRGLGVFSVVGGPYASVDPRFFAGRYDVLFEGEADTTWPSFLDEFAAGRPHQSIYRQDEPTDLSTLPLPRVDLVDAARYASGAVQFSRGCPFTCEFCDIIVTNGRIPRTKRPDQVIAELEDMRRAGFRHVFVVDDNFIGHIPEARALLTRIISWQEEHDYPVRLSTEASINLADDRELPELMHRANFRHVFIGIETPRHASLVESKKLQNVRGDSMDAKLARLRAAGLDVHGGFIVGFDHDDAEVFDEQYDFIQRNGIQLAMVGMLTAIPSTPLFERLRSEDRLVEDDPNCNIVPKLMTRDELRRRYWDLVERVYEPSAFLDRVLAGYRDPAYRDRRAALSRRTTRGRWKRRALGIALMWALFRSLASAGRLKQVGGVYARYLLTRNRRAGTSVGLTQFMGRLAEHWHLYRFTQDGKEGRLRLFNSG